MHIPIARQEIADFLEVEPSQVEPLWVTGKLKRSLHDDIRPIPALAQSSVFDLIEYVMSYNIMPISVSSSEAAMWVLYLCEVCESEEWHEWTIEDRAAHILAYAAHDGLISDDDMKAAKAVATLIATHTTLINICLENDARNSGIQSNRTLYSV